MLEAKIIADTLSPGGVRITTMQLVYPRFIHSEFMTHRVFSRNAMSSRAVPVHRMIAEVRRQPVVPWHWGKNQPGMQAREEMEDPDRSTAITHWLQAARYATDFAEELADLGVHKQNVNRLLEPFQWMRTVVTSTEWSNFFALRRHPDAEPHIHDLADAMHKALSDSYPSLNMYHAPYVHVTENFLHAKQRAMVSAARCARVSYNKHDGTSPIMDEDLALAQKLIDSRHASPFEHAARFEPGQHANYYGWKSFRSELGI